jgi:dUTP pyrophosphatase
MSETETQRVPALDLKVQKQPEFENFHKAHDTDAAFDLYATHDGFVYPGRRIPVKVGIATSFSSDYVMFIKSRSGNARKFGMVAVGGVIDSGYRGEWEVILSNTQPVKYVLENGKLKEKEQQPFRFKKGDKVAQTVPIRIDNVQNEEVRFVEELEDSERGSGGFGSTDKPTAIMELGLPGY